MGQMHGHDGLGLSLRKMAEALASDGEDAFVQRYGALLLVVNGAQIEPPEGPAVTQGFDARAMALGVTHAGFPLRKTPGANELPFISIGRTRNNDVWIHDKSLSKFQAYVVTNDAGEQRIFDAGSTNGTFVNGVAAPTRGAGEPLLVEPGAYMAFGELKAFVWRSVQVVGWQGLAGLSGRPELDWTKDRG